MAEADRESMMVKMQDEKTPPCVKGRKRHSWGLTRRGKRDAFRCPFCRTVQWYEYGPKHGSYTRFDVGEFSGKDPAVKWGCT